MTRLTQIGENFEWDAKCDDSFQKLKTLLTITPILTIPKWGMKYAIYCDASREGLGWVLMRQRRWTEYMEQYNFDLQYHPRKTNVVTGALSGKT